MKRERNRKIILAAAVLLLIVALGLAALGIFWFYPLNQAKTSARQHLSSDAAYLSYHFDENKYTLRFFDTVLQERSEIEVDRTSNQVIKIQTQKAAYVYPGTAVLDEEKLTEIVRNEISDAVITDIVNSADPGQKYVTITYSTGGSRGSFRLDPENGTIIARTIKPGKPVVIPSASGEDIGLLTLSELKAIGSGKVPGAVFQDLDIVYADGTFYAEINLYLEGMKYDLILDAISGKELDFDYYEDNWKQYGSWEPTELDTALLNITNLTSSLTLSKSTAAFAPGDVPSESSSANESSVTLPSATYSEPSTGSAATGSETASSPSPTTKPSTGPTVTVPLVTSASEPEPTAAQTQAPAAPEATESVIISMDRARELVLSRFPGAEIEQIELDEEDGRLLYNGKATDQNTEINFEIDAYTGTFAKWDIDQADMEDDMADD